MNFKLPAWVGYFSTRFLAIAGVVAVIWLGDYLVLGFVNNPSLEDRLDDYIALVDERFAGLEGIETGRLDNLIGIHGDIDDLDEDVDTLITQMALILWRIEQLEDE